jgi:hypothetical protein
MVVSYYRGHTLQMVSFADGIRAGFLPSLAQLAKKTAWP